MSDGKPAYELLPPTPGCEPGVYCPFTNNGAYHGVCLWHEGPARTCTCDGTTPHGAADPSRLPSGEWRCVVDGRTEPCGECAGCREVQAENRAGPAYGLVVPFVVCTSQGGPYDDEAFVSGWRLGELDARLELGRPPLWDGYVVPGDVPQLDLVAMRRGYAVALDDPADGWVGAHLSRTADPDAPTPAGLTDTAEALRRAVAAIERAWDETCCGNRNEAACESCRAYADAILTVTNLGGNGTPGTYEGR